jgi:Uri superfamily endonuclease
MDNHCRTSSSKSNNRQRVGSAIFPAAPGTYLLLIRPQTSVTLEVGKKGVFHVAVGCYAYVGSAHGSGGLRARLNRHIRSDKRLHWHIDYLTVAMPIDTICTEATEVKQECAWVRKLLALPGASIPIPQFGNGDCREGCPAHLVQLPTALGLNQLASILSPKCECFAVEPCFKELDSDTD